MQFENVAREWRCKWKDDGGGKASSKALVEIADLVDEYLPKLKALDGAVVNRAVCGGCLDFKLATTVCCSHHQHQHRHGPPLSLLLAPIRRPRTQVPLSTFGPWEEAGHPPEEEFLEKLKKIDGVSQVETQTMTNQVL